jgi:insulin-like growth factor-binding protein complex acid labile subunit
LNRNEIRTFPPDGPFDELTNLQTLSLNVNEITVIPPNVFDSLTQLVNLNLGGNAIIAIPDGIFDNLIKLEVLHLFNNDITGIPIDAFDSLTQLTTLSLDHNAIATIPCDTAPKPPEDKTLLCNGKADDVETCSDVSLLCAIFDVTKTLCPVLCDSCVPLETTETATEVPVKRLLSLFDSLTQLEFLSLNYNAIEAIPSDGPFDKLVKLEELLLYGTRV